jgi:hypothetical protein
VGAIKRSFTGAWVAGGGWEGGVSDSRSRNRRRGVWQRRFWGYVIRDETDLARHLDYIHYNPIKHGLAECAHAWPWSSFTGLCGRAFTMPGGVAGVTENRWRRRTSTDWTPRALNCHSVNDVFGRVKNGPQEYLRTLQDS